MHRPHLALLLRAKVAPCVALVLLISACSKDNPVVPTPPTGFTWTELQGPPGGWGLSLTEDAQGSVYLAAGAGGIFRSTDQGTSWSYRGGGTLGVFADQVQAGNGDTLFVAMSTGVLRSTDRGASWSFLSGFPGGGWIDVSPSGWVYATANGVYRWKRDTGWSSLGLAGEGVSRVAVLDGNLIAGTYGSKMFRSTDQGVTWQTFITPSRVQTLCFLKAADGSYLAGNLSFGLWKSVDAGVTWAPVPFPALTVNSLRRGPGSQVLAGTENGMYLSPDHGASWSQIGPSGPFVSDAIFLSSGALVAAYFGGVLRANSTAGAWVESNSGLACHRITTLSASANGDLYAGTPSNGLYRSSGTGAGWTHFALPDEFVVDLLIRPNGNWVLASGHGIFQSSNSGGSWQFSDYVGRGTRGFVESVSGRLITAATGGLLLSEDQGAHWILGVVQPAGIQSTFCFARDSTAQLFAGTTNGGIFRSTDHGLTWSPANTGLPAGADVNAIGTSPSGTLFASVTPGGIFRSTDHGDHWIAVAPSITSGSGFAFDDRGQVITHAANRFYGSSDGGNTWQAIGDANLPGGLTRWILHHDGFLYAGSDGRGVFRSSTAVATGGSGGSVAAR